MDVQKAVSVYIEKMCTDVRGMKVLLLDSETTPIISTASTQSSLLSHEVYLTDRVDNLARDRMRHLKCIAFLRPSNDSIESIVQELKEPKYGEYHLYFSNILKKSAIERLAEADEHEVVKEVQEYFADYVISTSSFFSLNLNAPPARLYGETPNVWDPVALERSIQGLVALLLSLKKKPTIRYEKMSAMAKKLGGELQFRMQQEQSIFEFRRTDVPPLLLILDRRNDPVTPLLSQWTYQAMAHELIGINNGRVDLSGSPDIRPELREIVLSTSQDPFFSSNLYANFGDLGAALQGYVADYQERTQAHNSNKLETIADMKRFVEEYPEFRKLGGNVSKHVTLVGELSRLVEKEKLLEVSEVEQSLASNESHATDLKSVQTLISDAEVSPEAKTRLAILYALRYQKMQGNAIPSIVEQLLKNGVDEARALLVFIMLNFAGAEQRQDDLFANQNFFSRGRSALKGLKGVENVFTQHSPHLAQTIELLMKGRLKDTSYPFLDSQPNIGLQRPQDVIVFIIGGATFEEARTIALLNQQGANGPGAGARFLLGGTSIHNSRSFLDMVTDAARRFPSSMLSPPSSALSNPAPGLKLQLGNVNLSVGSRGGSGAGGNSSGSRGSRGGATEQFQEGAQMAGEAARDVARDLLGRVKKGVDRIAL